MRKAQQLRAVEVEGAARSYEKASEGSLHEAAEFLRMVQKGDAVYDSAMRRAHQRYLMTLSREEGEPGPRD